MTFLKMKSLSFFFTILLLSLSPLFSDARKFNVGGSGAWVPNPSENYQSWSGQNRFLVHDTLYFSYAKGADSVLEVNKADYDGCNTKNPIKRADDGASEISLDRYGPFYFISGNEDNCKKGQKLTVVVISPRTLSPGGSPPGSTTPPGGAHSPKSSSPVSPTTSPPGSMAPKSGSPVSPTTSPPGSMAPKSSTSPPAPPKSSSPVSPSSAPMTSPPAPMAPKSSSTVPPSSAPMTSPPAPMAPKSSSIVPPSSAPMTSPPGPMAPESSSPAVSPSMAPGDSTSLSPSGSPSANSPSGSGMGPSGDGPSASSDISTPAGAPGQKKSSANGMAVMSITTTVLSLVLTIFM
ncbi:early nodulin-like protein 2 isoform X2 [Capsella rubella]|uniref:early nodulin-like protein 2 isoform X2 n=1 Tax=Capsella rubella TaxID=81985 RepID=UPI000CD4A498|nr:early nodulin-like protein 2 isoform X2 [Capsella rubella]